MSIGGSFNINYSIFSTDVWRVFYVYSLGRNGLDIVLWFWFLMAVDWALDD